MQARGDAMIGIASDFQEPPDLIPQMIEAWEAGYSHGAVRQAHSGRSGLVVLGPQKQYYKTVERLSSVETVQVCTGFGLYTREVVDLVQRQTTPTPASGSIIAEISLPNKRIYFDQPALSTRISKNNFYTLYDIAITG